MTLKPLFPLFIFFLFATSLSAQSKLDIKIDVYFETSLSELSNSAKAKLQPIINFIKENGDYKLTIGAFTDSRGTHDYNEKLAQGRASSVMKYLSTQSLITDDVSIETFGERQAGNDISSEELRQQNRRVEVHFLGWDWQNLQSLKDSLKVTVIQNFKINSAKEKLIKGNKGGLFFIPQNAFIDEDGKNVEGNIKIEIVECYTIEEMLKHGLTTTSKDRILESGGMFNISAFQNGKRLKLKEKATIYVSSPTKSIKKRMRIFNGSTSDLHNTDNLDWASTDNLVTGKIPKLKFPKGPKRPKLVDMGLALKEVKLRDIEELQNLIKPKKPRLSKPVKPIEKNYSKIKYINKGFKDRFISKSKRHSLTEEKRNKEREKYKIRLKNYKSNRPHYDSIMTIYNDKLNTYIEERAKIIDENGFIKVESPTFKRIEELANKGYDEKLKVFKLDSALFVKYKNKKIATFAKRMEKITQFETADVKNYMSAVNMLGWINIDRFINKELLANLEITVPSSSKEDIMISFIIPKDNIILKMGPAEGNTYSLPRIPLGKEAKVLAVKVINNVLYISTQSFITQKNQKLVLDFKKSRLSDIRAELAKN